MAPLAQRVWQDDPEQEARSYMERIDERVFYGDIHGARALVAEAIEKGVRDERLSKPPEPAPEERKASLTSQTGTVILVV